MPFWNGLFWQMPMIQRKILVQASKAGRVSDRLESISTPSHGPSGLIKLITVVSDVKMRTFYFDQGRSPLRPADQDKKILFSGSGWATR